MSEHTYSKNQAAVELGRLGGKKGGPARARKLTSEQRSAIARKAACARWKKTKNNGAFMGKTWKKKFTASEAIRPNEGAEMPFIRCTKAGHDIDHSTWFREELFAGAGWRQPVNKPESVEVPFHVKINGQDMGMQTLVVDYKPNRSPNNSAPTVHILYNEPITTLLRDGRDMTGHTLTITADSGRYSLNIS